MLIKSRSKFISILLVLAMVVGLCFSTPPHAYAASTTGIVTEHFADEIQGATIFTNSEFTYNLGGRFKITNVSTYGWTGTENDDWYVDNYSDLITSAGVVGSIQIASGTCQAHSIYIFPGETGDYVSDAGTVIILGKKSGATQFTKTISNTEINKQDYIDHGFTFVDLSAYNAIEIDTLEFSLTGSLRYLAVDAFKHESTAPASTDATLKAASTIKGQTVTSLGTPNASLGSETAGTATITAAKAADTSNAESFITLFNRNETNATVKAVKYASGASTANFSADAAYANEAVTNGDFFIIKVTAQDMTTVKYYRINVTVTAASSISTQAVSSIGTTTATGNGNVTSLGVPDPTAHGVCWNTTDTPTISDSKADNGAKSSTGAFTAAMTGLVPNTTYHVRAYATNAADTSYGEEVEFATLAVVPTAATNAASGVSSTGATLNGTVNANNASTTISFEYGLTNAYGSAVTAEQSPVTGTADTSVSKSITGLNPNTTYHYRVKGVNAAGTTNGSDQTFTTSAVVPTATTGEASGVGATGATLNGTVNANNASTTVTFEYGLTNAYGSVITAEQSPVTGTVGTSVNKTIAGLLPNTTYHFRVVGVNAGGTTNGSDQTFATSAIAPTVSTSTASGLSSTGVTLNGTVNANNASTTVSFEYGLTNAYGSAVTAEQSPVTGTSDTSVSKSITGLSPNTTYHYRAKGVNAAGTTNGSDQTFTTSAVVPTATTGAASGVSATGATLNGTVNANNASTTVTFEYGLTNAYGSVITAEQSPVTGTVGTSVNKTIAGLLPNTTYHFRVVGVNAGGTTNGSDQTFATSAIAPTVSTSTASGLSSTGVTLNGTVNANNASTTVSFEYGLTNAYGSAVTAEQSPVTGTSDTSVGKSITGLSPNTTYHYRAKGVNAAGTTNGSDQTFTTTAVAPTATTGAVSGVGATGATLNGTVNANNASTTVTFEYGLTNAYGSAITAEQSPVAGTAGTSVNKTITGLVPNTTYHYRVVGTNSGGTTNGSDQTFATSAIAPTVSNSTTSSLSTTEVTLNGTVNANNASTTVSFEYGLTNAYGSAVTAEQSPVTGTADTSVSKSITGLSPNTTYHYRIKGVNATGTTTSSDQTFTTSAVVPTATTGAASGVGATGATLNGTVNANNASTTVTFEYGLTNAYGSAITAEQSPVAGTAGTSVNKTITGLVPNTTYHYRVVGTNSGGTTNGSDQTFTTSAIAPAVITNAASALSTTGATLNATVNANNASTTATFEYGLTIGYGTTVTGDQSPVTGTANTSVSKVITGLSPNTTYHYRAIGVNGTGTTNGSDQTFTTSASATSNNSGGGGGSSTPAQPSPGPVNVVVNGKDQSVGNETKATEDGKTTVTVGVNNKAIESKIDEAIKNNATGTGNVIQVSVTDTKSEVAKVELTGDTVKKLEQSAFDVSIKRDNVEYIISAEEFTISKVAEKLGIQEKDLDDIKVEVKITKLDEKVVKKYNEVAKANGAELVFPPVEFEITAKTIKTNGTTQIQSINKFSNYVERVMEIPAGINPSKITTGIVFNPDGTYSHVPTEVYQKNGKWYARLNSLTNSNYSVVWNPVTVKSVEGHWSKDTVNDMASRLVIFNTDSFDPDKGITRADFAEYIIRALGLYREGSIHGNKYKDVNNAGERTLAILTASEYGIVTGYMDETFRPDQQITREEAMVMYQRAMKITKLEGTDKTRYLSYVDHADVSDWAAKDVNEVLSAHVFNGTGASTISPKEKLTYAEAAQAVKNLLIEAKLINK